MISIEALEKAGFSNKVLKRILTAQPTKSAEQPSKRKVPVQKAPGRGAPLSDGNGTVSTLATLEKLPENPTDWDRRCYLETLIRGEVTEGQMRCTANFDKWAAMDLAYASIPIHPIMPDLMKLAMGYVTLEQCESNIAGISEEWKKTLFERDAKGKATGVNVPKLIDVSHNLVHSLVTRRVAAAATEIYQQYPVLKYEPFSNNQTERLKADVNTQLAEQMAGAFNYRHDYEESIRQASLYSTSFKFKAKAWHVDKQRLPVTQPTNGAEKAGVAPEVSYEDKIIREGVLWVLPHPSRTSWDISQPLSKINSDLGPDWMDFFEVVPVHAIRGNPGYWNTDALVADGSLYTWFNQYLSYFNQYYGCSFSQGLTQAETMFPRVGKVSAGALSLSNDRVANIGTYAQNARDIPTVLSQHYKRIIPKDYGIGTYPYPVWVRFVMAANTTIVFAEIMGSAPCSVNGHNAADGLLVNPSFGMQAAQFQQMLTNDLTELRWTVAQGLIRIWALNIHGMKKDEVELVENALKFPDFAQLKDVVIKYDQEVLNQRGQDVGTITQKIAQIRVETASKTKEIFDRMVNTIALAERLLFFSPQELGQVSPRTTSATEQKAIRDTTLGIRDWALVSIKQQMDADKRIIHSSYLAFGSDELEVPVAERYPREVIEKAGFTIVDDGTGNPPDGLFTVRGKKLGLYYNYTFTTRNTDDTPPEAQEAQALAQIYEVTLKDEDLKSMLTNSQKLEMFNAFAQKISPNFPRINLPQGVDPNGRSQTKIDQVAQAIPQLGQALQQLAQKQAEQDQRIAQSDAGIKALADALSQLTKLIQPPSTPPVRTDVPTQRGQIAPDFPQGAGAAPLRGVRQARAVPALG